MDLVLSDLSCGRGGLPVLEGLSLRVAPGEAVVLTGRNGVGKTTLLRTVAGLAPPLGGRIEGAEERVAYFAHADAVKPMLTVGENLAFWAALHGHRDVAGAMAAFGLEPLAQRLGRELSAGQRRRAGLARLLVTGRPVWLLDEPSVSLDAAATVMLATVIGTHLRSGGVAMIATHIDLGLSSARTFDLAPFRAGVGPDPFAGVAA